MFAGCVKQYPIYQDIFLAQTTYKWQEGDSSFLLSVQCSHSECMFALLDLMGAPVVSRQYKNGEFSNTKFLPPNSRYDELFFEIIKNPNQQFYKQGSILIERIDE